MPIPYTSDLLEAVIQATPDAIFVKDLDGRYVLVNDAFARFIGKSSADIIGRHDLELYDKETAGRFIESDQEVLRSGVAQQFEALPHGETGLTTPYPLTNDGRP